MGFSVYSELTCKQCKPDRFFHKREGLRIHSGTHHGKELAQRHHLPIKSNSEPSIRPTRASTRSVLSRGSTYGISQSKELSKAADVEIVELEDEDEDEIEIVGEHCEQVDDNGITPVEITPVVLD